MLLDYSFFISSTFLISCCFFCCIMLWIVGRHSRAKKILAFSFSVSVLYNTYFSVKTFYIPDFATEIFDFSYGIFCLFIVYMAFLYFRALMLPDPNNKPIVRQILIFFAAYGLLYGLISLTEKQTVFLYSFQSIKDYAAMPIVWLRILIFVHFIIASVVLCVSTLKMYKRHREEMSSLFSYSEEISLRWLPYMLGLFIFTGIGTSFDIFLPLNGLGLDISNYAYTAFNMTIAFMAAFQKDIYRYPYHDNDSLEILSICNHDDINYERNNHSISLATRLQLKENVLDLMEKDKIYLNPELRIDYIIKRLGTNRTYLSLVFKEDFGKNFIEFVNFYRIEEAKQLISEKNNNSSLSEVAEIVGFKSISSFNIFFKRFTEMTPTEYRRAYFEKIVE